MRREVYDKEQECEEDIKKLTLFILTSRISIAHNVRHGIFRANALLQ